jgi:hypothetical protein
MRPLFVTEAFVGVSAPPVSYPAAPMPSFSLIAHNAGQDQPFQERWRH